MGLPSKVVAVIENNRAAPLKFEHCLDMTRHRIHCAAFVSGLVCLAKLGGGFNGKPGGNITVKNIVRGSLVGDCVRTDATTNHFGHELALTLQMPAPLEAESVSYRSGQPMS